MGTACVVAAGRGARTAGTSTILGAGGQGPISIRVAGGSGGEDAAPGIAWLRYWIYGDQSQKDWFFGDNCKLCDWPDFRRKNHPEWQ